MSDLLSAGERQEFRDAMTDLKDTFHKSSVAYKVSTDTTDRFGEKRIMSGTVHVLNCFLQYSDLNDDKYRFKTEGITDETFVKVTLNVDYLDGLGLWDAATKTVKFNGEKDTMTVNGMEYMVTQVTYSSSLDGKPVHVFVYGDPQPKKT